MADGRGVQTVPKSVRAIHVLATPWQPRGKHLNPPAPLHSRRRTHRAGTFSLRHCSPLLLFFYLQAPRLVRERDKEREGEGRYRGNNATQWAGESGFFLAIALVKFCLFGSRTLGFSRHAQGMYRMIWRGRKIIRRVRICISR